MLSTRTYLDDDRRLEDYTALEHILLGDVRDLLEEQADEENMRWLAVLLDALLQTKQMQFRIQQQGGFLSEVLQLYPNWEPQVERLREEHADLFAGLRRLRRRLEQGDRLGEAAAEVRRDLREWMLLLQAHRRHVRRIVQSAFNLEVGVGD